jgi:hypothetical protein
LASTGSEMVTWGSSSALGLGTAAAAAAWRRSSSRASLLSRPGCVGEGGGGR